MIFVFVLMLTYIGPGLGGGVITAVLGVLTSIFLALFAILWYPIKKVIQKFKKKEDEPGSN
jgi:4-hydroxybenzoate polyprenyltransferase